MKSTVGAKDGEAYELRVGRWSRLAAREFLSWLRAPRAGRWLDVGAGTGALSAGIGASCAPAMLVALDPSIFDLRCGRFARASGGAWPVAADASALPFAAGSFDVVVSALALNFLADPVDALVGIARIASAGGTIGAYVWDFGGEMQPHRRFWDAAIALDPGAARLDQAVKFPLCRPGALTSAFRRAGLRGVEGRTIDVAAVFHDFDDLWLPFVSGDGSVVDYARSLPPAKLAALRERVRASVGEDVDGRIRLLARAFAARGRAAGPAG